MGKREEGKLLSAKSKNEKAVGARSLGTWKKYGGKCSGRGRCGVDIGGNLVGKDRIDKGEKGSRQLKQSMVTQPKHRN